MKHLVGRNHEISIFESLLGSDEPQFIAVYGRRRVGKTFLIREFFKQKGLYFELTGVKDADLHTQLGNFLEALTTWFQPDIPFAQPKTWVEAFRYLKVLLEKESSKKKVIIFFDELPWLASKKSGFKEALDHFWNHWASQKPNLILVVCGSAASWMITHILHDKGGLHNRITRQIRLLPFTLSETRQLFEQKNIRFDEKQIADIYMAMGGIPYYLNQIVKGFSAAQNINKLCFSKDGVLVDEFERIYRSLFDSPELYLKIVEVLASAPQGLTRNQLLAKLKRASGSTITLALQGLEESGFIQKYIPFEKKMSDAIYWLSDEYSLFYLKWIRKAPGSILNSRSHQYWLERHQTPSYKSWAGLAFEKLCRKHVFQIKKALGISGISSNEAVWRRVAKGDKKIDKGCQIDLLIDRGDHCISVCEMKYSENPFVISKAYAEELKGKIAIFKQSTETKKTVFLTLVTVFGVEPNAYRGQLVSNEVMLKDLFQ